MLRKYLLVLIICIVGRNLAAATCENGYYIPVTTNVPVNTIVGTTMGECLSGYTAFPIDRAFMYQTRDSNGCGVGQYWHNNTCKSYATGGCDSGFYAESLSNSYKTFDMTYHGECLSGYEEYVSRQDILYLMSKVTAKCGPTQYPTATGCANYPVSDCPTNYHTTNPATSFLRPFDEACGAEGTSFVGYSDFNNDVDLCRKYMGDDMASVCTPQRLCNAGVTTLRARYDNQQLSWPIYRDKITDKALNFGFDNGDVCYLNMLPGADDDALNVRDSDNNIYHGVD